MYTHAPPGYRSPFLALIEGREPVGGVSRLSDVFYRDSRLTAFISAARYAEAGGNALVVPNEPFENLYIMPDDLRGELHAFSKQLALAFKTVYGCDGVLVRQHNEPGGSQDVWHYHLHVIPRFAGDGFYAALPQKIWTTPAEREPYARRLRGYFAGTPA